MKRKNELYTCADTQNEMWQIMALAILRDTAKDIKNLVYNSLMADEATDGSNREQLVIVIRLVSEDLVSYEEFIGLAISKIFIFSSGNPEMSEAISLVSIHL